MSWMDGGATRARSRACSMLQTWWPGREPTKWRINMPPLPGQQQQAESFINGAIHDVLVRPLRKFRDERGWLAELFRQDELAEEFYPAMAYVSATLPGVTRGPHEHVDQADF